MTDNEMMKKLREVLHSELLAIIDALPIDRRGAIRSIAKQYLGASTSTKKRGKLFGRFLEYCAAGEDPPVLKPPEITAPDCHNGPLTGAELAVMLLADGKSNNSTLEQEFARYGFSPNSLGASISRAQAKRLLAAGTRDLTDKGRKALPGIISRAQQTS